jgi:riboflavin biosynthesis pyrimidine reductase
LTADQCVVRWERWGIDSAQPIAVATLQTNGMRRILCEGGPTLLDELATDRPGAQALTAPARLALGHVVTLEDYVYLRYVRPGHDASG